VHLTTVHHPHDPRIFHKQLKTLRDAGYDAQLVASHKQSETVDGIPITALSQVKGRYRRIRLQREVYQEARRLNADVYHIHDPELIPVGHILQRVTGAALIYDMHEDYWWHGPVEGRLIRLLERWCFQWVDHVVVANDHHQDITRSSAVPATRIANYFKPIGHVPIHAAHSCFSDEEPLRLIYTGVISDQGGRGLSSLIRLAELVHREAFNAKLKLVGICYVDRIRRQAAGRIERNGLRETLQRVGWDRYVSWEEMVPHLQRAHVGLVLGTPHPNQAEKIPTKFYEYLHFGLPILCSDFPRWRQFVEQHECGAVVPAGDPNAALNVLRRWRNDPDRYHTLARAARAAAPLYRWESMQPRLIRVYDELTA
jgi:glycosyltransferase involved in cell wall biosynthesis